MKYNREIFDKKYILKNKIKIIPSSDFLDRVTWIRIVKKKVGKNVGIFSKVEFWNRVTKIQMLKKRGQRIRPAIRTNPPVKG